MFDRFQNPAIFYAVLAVAYLVGWGVFCAVAPAHVAWTDTLPLLLYSACCLAVAILAFRIQGIRLAKLSMSDPNTNLYNERFFLNALKLEFSRSHRHELPLSIMVFSFGDINETAKQLERNVKDIRKLFIHTVSETIRSSDIFSVLEQDKYSILLPSTDVDGAKVAASRLKEAIATELKKIRLGQRTTMPFGICGTSSNGAESSDELFAGSMQAYSVARNSPRNTVVICGEACR
ncbi:GGDEF domain-containing protein [Pseudodesulfovibrio cashew]|nr:diguanylate cyclase [Pseudodesulfovibrio cashew]